MVKPLRASLYARPASSSRNKATCFLVIPIFSESRFMVSDFEIPATYSSSSAYPACFARILHERTRCRGARPLGPQRRIIVTVTLRVADEPPDRPEWLRETIRLFVDSTTDQRTRLRADFPGELDAARTARHPYFGDLNCFGWLLMLPIHYKGHLAALRAGRPSAL